MRRPSKLAIDRGGQYLDLGIRTNWVLAAVITEIHSITIRILPILFGHSRGLKRAKQNVAVLSHPWEFTQAVCPLTNVTNQISMEWSACPPAIEATSDPSAAD